jgi:hypothetical protein
MGINRITWDKEKLGSKVEKLIGSQHSSSGGREQPSKYLQNKSGYKMTIQDAQGKEASRSIIRWKSSHMCLINMEGIAFV